MSEPHNAGDRPNPTGPGAPPPPLESLYQEIILSHYRRPRNHGAVEAADARVHMNNPTCGDEIELSLRMDGDRIAAVGFEGQGCSISQASASMMTVLLQGRTLEEAEELAASFRDLVHGRANAASNRALGDLRALAGVSRYPVRVRCALLAWNALEEAGRRVSGASPPPDPAAPS
jgi:nitrogen fixation NifU-like protein